MKKQNTAALALNTVTATQAKTSFAAVLARAGYQGQRIVIKKGARPTAVILGYEDFQRLADLEDRFESAVLRKSLNEDRFLTLDEVTKRLHL
jgi:prevent-host-death family protein